MKKGKIKDNVDRNTVRKYREERESMRECKQDRYAVRQSESASERTRD